MPLGSAAKPGADGITTAPNTSERGAKRQRHISPSPANIDRRLARQAVASPIIWEVYQIAYVAFHEIYASLTWEIGRRRSLEVGTRFAFPRHPLSLSRRVRVPPNFAVGAD